MFVYGCVFFFLSLILCVYYEELDESNSSEILHPVFVFLLLFRMCGFVFTETRTMNEIGE